MIRAISNTGTRTPYAPCVLESHLCAGCGTELRRIASPPDRVYALPVCVCPGCGLACVRRGHRLRTVPVAFRRLDRALTRLALAMGVVVVSAGTTLVIAVLMSRQSPGRGSGPFVATYEAIRSSPPEDVLSIGLAVGSGAMVLAISGVLLGRVLSHWRPVPLVAAWAALLIVLSLTPAARPLIELNWPGLRLDLTDRWPGRLQTMAACAAATTAGVLIDRGAGRRGGPGRNRRLARSLRSARRRLARRRAG